MSTQSSQYDKFQSELEKAYEILFATDRRYSSVSISHTPHSLAVLMTEKLTHRSADKSNTGVKMACKVVGIKPNWNQIIPYLTEE